MNIELISIGSELLTGKTVNTNASFIGNELLLNGYKLKHIQTIVDTKEEIEEALREALSRADFVITTGGLGPTGDDLTKKCVADLFGTSMRYYPEIEKELQIRFPNIPGHEDQATYPEGALLLENQYGTALGFIVAGKVGCLPGVPSQMKEIFLQGLLPFLKKQFEKEYTAQSVYIAGKIESDVDPFLRELEKKYPTVEIGICPSWGYLSVYFVGKDMEEVSLCVQAIRARFKNDIYSESSPDISVAIHEQLQQRKITIGLAESCTGGHLASQITQHSGASEYFLGSLVTYSNDAKKNVLSVSAQTLTVHGAVSEEIAIEMAIGAKKVLGSSIGIGVTGIAGPTGGSREKPVGTVWIALCDENDELTTQLLTRGGERMKVIERATNTALQMIWRNINGL